MWIPDVGEDVMRHFLLYLYGSRIPAEMDEQLAEELLVVADKYDVERLKHACEIALGGWGFLVMGKSFYASDADNMTVWSGTSFVTMHDD